MGARAWDRDMSVERALVKQLTDFRLMALNKTNDRAYSFTEVARRANIPPPNLYNWERGVCLPSSMSLWIAWASALGLDLNISLHSPSK